jgi:gliding motility-associated-like protein
VNPVKGESYAWSVSGGSLSGGSVGSSIKVNWGAAGAAWVGVISAAYDSVSKLPCLSPLSKLPVVLNGAPKLSPLNDVVHCQTKTPLSYWTGKNAGVKKYEYDFSGLKVTPNVSADSSQWLLLLNLDTFGTFAAKIRAISQTGCPGPWVTAIITINAKPKTQLISGSAAVCVPNITSFSYGITGLPNSTFAWSVVGGSFVSAPSPTSSSVNIDWTLSAQPGFVQVIERSDKGCAGDTLRLEVFVDNSSLDLRWVSIAPPPSSDGTMNLRFELLNGPRNVGNLDIERRPAGGATFAKVGSVATNDTFYSDNTIAPDASAYEYRIATKNLCGQTLYSAPHTSVLLNGVKTGPFTMNITFSGYLGFPGGIARYELYRSLPGSSGFQLYQNYTTPTADNFNNGQDNYQQIFRIKAYEQGGNRVSWSNDIVINFEPVVFIPDAFTPNNNGRNEVFLPYTGGLKTYMMSIYDRWGEKIFETNSTTEGWDGTVGGKLAMEGVYVYRLQYSDFKNKEYSNVGTLHLIR